MLKNNNNNKNKELFSFRTIIVLHSNNGGLTFWIRKRITTKIDPLPVTGLLCHLRMRPDVNSGVSTFDGLASGGTSSDRVDSGGLVPEGDRNWSPEFM